MSRARWTRKAGWLATLVRVSGTADRSGDDIAARVDDADADEGAVARDVAGDHRRPARRAGEFAARVAAGEAAGDIAGDQVCRLERAPDILFEGDRPVDVLADGVVDRLAALESGLLGDEPPDAGDEQQAEAPDQSP